MSKTVVLVASSVLCGLVASCAGPVDPGVPGEGVTVQARAPLGVAGAPLVELATGIAVADELVVQLEPRTDARTRAMLIERVEATVAYRASTGHELWRFADAEAAERAQALLAGSPAVAEVARNHVMRGEDAGGTGIGTSPSGPLVFLQWNLYAMQMDPWERTPASGVVVAVLDTGVAYENHVDATGTYAQAPDLAEVDFLPGWDFVNDDAHANDDQRHGTHVTGVIAATSGIASMAPGAVIMPVKVLDGVNAGTELALAEGIRYAADHGAQVINMSLSFPPTYFPSRMLQSAVDYASQKGVVMIAAVGNHGEDIVAYPAAFRDVIAVGASDLEPCFHGWGSTAKKVWKHADDSLERAPYSNRSYKVDVLAPAGTIPGDANWDGQPEAVLAQTFAPGHPEQFGYYFYAGTSQAAAQVSGLAAVLIAENPDLGPSLVRALLVENARKLDGGLLSRDSGRGAIRYEKTVAAATDDDATDARDRFHANVLVTLHDGSGGKVRAKARVEIVNSSGTPVKHATVYGMFTGAAFGAVSGSTDSKGQVEFTSAWLEGNLVVAFQVDAVSKGSGAHAAFDRPSGFVRIDTVSLDRLSRWGGELAVPSSGSGIGTSPSGIASSGVDGAGIGTSPSGPSYQLPTDPQQTPITVGYDAALFAGTSYRPTLTLPSFSWGMATVPMAVAVDEQWFLATFPGAADRRVVSRGKGIGASPLRFDAESFPPPPPDVPPPPPPPDSIPLPVMLMTFNSGLGTTGTGIGTSPSGPERSIIIDRTYSGLDAVFVDTAEDLIAGWYASGAGIGTSPSIVDPAWAALDAGTFAGLSSMAQSYWSFGGTPLAAPVAAYGAALGAAAMPMAPVAPDADGAGLGVAALP